MANEVKCRRCGLVKSVDAFSPHSRGRFGVRNVCKPCSSQESIEWRDANRDKVLNAHLLRTFGITLDEYNKILADQGGVCAICRRGEEISPTKRSVRQGYGGRLVVDHDHKSGRIRGLLCTWCNIGLGNFEDQPARLLSAIRYLEGG